MLLPYGYGWSPIKEGQVLFGILLIGFSKPHWLFKEGDHQLYITSKQKNSLN